MKLAVYNGSPRGKGSNSRVLLDSFLEGYGHTVQAQLYIYRAEDDALVQSFIEGDTIVIAFPLYTDSVPGKVKYFLEQIKDLEWRGKQIGIIVQSGFPEAVQSSFIAEYFQRIVEKKGADFLGAVIRGGVEGIQIQPAKWTAKLKERFHHLGQVLHETGSFDNKTISELGKTWKLGPVQRLFFGTMSRIGVTNFYWNYNLKKNGAFKERFARPYG